MSGNNAADRPGSLLESHKSYQPRVIFFHFVIAGLLVVVAAGLAWQQLFKADLYHEREKMQNQRRILVPGPRGNIYDREGRLLVGNRPRFAVVLYLDELRAEFRREFILVRKNYRNTGDKELPSSAQMEVIARASVVQRYLAKVNAILHRNEQVDSAALQRHFLRQLLLPYMLLDDLEPDEYARLLERLPVRSPLQVYTSSTRYYPHGSAAAHTLGYVSINPDIDAEDFPGGGLRTFKMKGTVGRDGLEKVFDLQLQGETGGTIFRVDPSGYKINPPLERRRPVQGKNLVTSLDLDLQLIAESGLEKTENAGAAVAIDVRTGEVLALASKPDYNLTEFSPRLSHAAAADIEARRAWTNLAVSGVFPPGSTFKILTAIAMLDHHAAEPADVITECTGTIRIGNRLFYCDNGRGVHGDITLRDAIAQSCDIYFYEAGQRTGADTIAAEAARFGLNRPTGIELPNETTRMLIPDTAWKQRARDEKWFPGDTANMAIGQGFIGVTPLQMACFAASVARGEVLTKPTLIHRDDAPTQRTGRIGLTPPQRAALLEGMVGCTTEGTADILTTLPSLRIPGLRIAGKTGTAQVRTAAGTINVAWFICFAPADNPEIAIAVAVQGDTPGETYGGGRNAGPIAQAVLRKYFDKKQNPPAVIALPKIAH
jgi:penicillin-binding protein 2